MHRGFKANFVFIISLLLAIWVVHPFLTGRYVFFLDQNFGPAWNPLSHKFFGFVVPSYGGGLPLSALLSGLTGITGVSALQKVLLVSVLVLLALTPYILFSKNWYIRLYASILFLFNPFVYTRFLVGQWGVLWGLAMLPLVLKSFKDYLDSGGYKKLLLTVLSLTLISFDLHFLFMSGILLLSLVVFKYIETKNISTIKRGIIPLLVFIPLNVYWLLPLLLSNGGAISHISSPDIMAFAPKINMFSALYSIASMHGFWRGGIVYARDIAPFTEYFYIIILFFAVHGFISYYRDKKIGYVVKALGVTAVIALLLGAGTSGPAAHLFKWAFDNVPFFKGMRDSQKFVGLLVLAYAYLGSLGVREFGRGLKSPVQRRKYISMGIVALALMTPFIYTFPMLTGFAGQIKPTNYPNEWYQVNTFLENNTEGSQILFLPWHLYMDFSWVPNSGKDIANPAHNFFSAPVIAGDNAEVGGIYSQSGKPVSKYVEFLFGLGPYKKKNITNLGELLVPLDVKYIVLTKEVDWGHYSRFLKRQKDLKLVYENRLFLVFENKHRVSRSYAIDKLVYVSGWNDFLNLSRVGNISEAVYVINKKREGEVIKMGEGGEALLNTEEINPARYSVEGTARPLTVFTQRQDSSYPYWMLNKEKPEYFMLGFIPVFKSSPNGGVIKYDRFYDIYLPSYVISILTFIGAMGYLFYDRRKKKGRKKD